MELNLSDIIKNDGNEKSFCGKVRIEPVKYMGLEVSFKDEVDVSGSVRNIGGVIELEADICGSLVTRCARCLELIEREFKAKTSETLAQEGTDVPDDSDVIVFSGYALPLDEIILNSILVSMDVRYLCSENCKGLCNVCGKNLNMGDCDCSQKTIDPRFEVLSKLCDK